MRALRRKAAGRWRILARVGAISFRPSLRTLLWIGVAVNVVGILLAGWDPRGFRFRNGAEWAAAGSGIAFDAPGLAYTEPFTTGDSADRVGEPGLTLELALRLAEASKGGFQFIAVVHGGDDAAQLLLAQWRDTLIVMNGDDYDHRRRSPRLSASIAGRGGESVFLTIRSDAGGSSLIADGTALATRRDLVLRLPTDVAPGRLVLGNSVYGGDPWRGTLEGFALHRRALDDATLRRHREQWQAGRGFAGDAYASAELAYPLVPRAERRAPDRSPNGIDLWFPRDTTLVTPRLFDAGLDTPEPHGSLDVLLNLFGFMPLGLLLAALLLELKPISRWTAVGAAIAIGLALSFGIESAQAWIPSRRSSLLDLLLNTAGTGLGAAAWAVLKPEEPR